MANGPDKLDRDFREVDPREATAEVSKAENEKPSLEDVELARPAHAESRDGLELESSARREYFRFIRGESPLQRDIREALGRAEKRERGRSLEETLLRLIRELVRRALRHKSPPQGSSEATRKTRDLLGQIADDARAKRDSMFYPKK